MASLRKKIKYTLLAAVFGYDDLLEWKGSKWIGRILSLLTPLKEMERLSIMCLEGSRKGRLLDVGYGSGFFLSTMQDLGWEVLGIEPDVQAANIAKEQFKVPVIVSTLEEVRLPASSFDAITMNHVIEHVPDPLGVLKECQRLLKPNGILVVTTPNFGSLGHRLFRQRWRGLEVPRHFYLFRTRTMLMIAEKAGFFVKSLTTSARFARGMFVASLFPSLEKRRNKPRVRYILHLFGLGFYALEAFIRYSLAPNIGEELVLIAEPRKEGKCLYISR